MQTILIDLDETFKWDDWRTNQKITSMVVHLKSSAVPQSQQNCWWWSRLQRSLTTRMHLFKISRCVTPSALVISSTDPTIMSVPVDRAVCGRWSWKTKRTNYSVKFDITHWYCSIDVIYLSLSVYQNHIQEFRFMFTFTFNCVLLELKRA